MSRLLLILPLLWASCAALAADAPTCRNNVAELDTEFQAAVKRNDAATVDRLLPNDYILVSATGQVATKADLVNRSAPEQVRLLSPGGQRSGGSNLGKHGRSDGALVGGRHHGRQALQPEDLVQ